MADLKPCPFCGGDAEIWRAHEGRTAWVACMGRCAVLVSKEYTTDADAIAAWNRRAPDPRDKVILGLLEALEVVVKDVAESRAALRPHVIAKVQDILDEARKLVRQPYMGQIMAECDCQRRDECQRAGRCIAEGNG